MKLSSDGAPISSSRRVLDVDIARERADEVAEAFHALAARLPEHPGILRDLALRVEGDRLCLDAPAGAGDRLDVALAAYGPAVIADAVPRLHRLADALDAAAAQGVTHGALHTHDVYVTPDDTRIAGIGLVQAVAAVDATLPGQRDDQVALAAIAYEWLFGEPPARPLVIPTLPDVDHAALARAFAVALADDPALRFASCRAFVRALGDSTAAAVPALPLSTEDPDDLPLGASDEHAGAGTIPLAQATPAQYAPRRAMMLTAFLAGGIALGALATWMLVAERPDPQTELSLDPAAPPVVPAAAEATDQVIEPALNVPNDAALSSAPSGRREGLGSSGTEGRGFSAGQGTEGRSVPGPSEVESSPGRVNRPEAARTSGGTLVIDSRPAGALVVIDGRRAGRTPMTIADVRPGRHTVRLEHAGYRSVTATVDVKAGERARVAARLEGGRYDE